MKISNINLRKFKWACTSYKIWQFVILSIYGLFFIFRITFEKVYTNNKKKLFSRATILQNFQLLRLSCPKYL